MQFKTEAAGRIHDLLTKIAARGFEHRQVFDMYLDWMLNFSCKSEKGAADRKRHGRLVTWANESFFEEFKAPFAICFIATRQGQLDILGDYFETCGFGDKTRGQVLTPEPLCDLLVEQVYGSGSIADSDSARVCDPCCGSGRMLLAAAKKQPRALFVGIEIDSTLARIAAINLAFHGLRGLVICADVFDITPGPLVNCTFEFAIEVSIPTPGFIKTIEPG